MWVKVCGVTTTANAAELHDSGVDAIGLNFYEKSKRYVTPEVAREIVRSLPASIAPIGLFVNHPVERIAEIADFAGLQVVQLHGDESLTDIVALHEFRPGLEIIKAYRVSAATLSDVADDVNALLASKIPIFGVLFDAAVAGEYGGTGAVAPWTSIAESSIRSAAPRLILAGGLQPENVCEAIQIVQPWGVDSAGGVETAPGVKAADQVQRFVAEAKAADQP